MKAKKQVPKCAWCGDRMFNEGKESMIMQCESCSNRSSEGVFVKRCTPCDIKLMNAIRASARNECLLEGREDCLDCGFIRNPGKSLKNSKAPNDNLTKGCGINIYKTKDNKQIKCGDKHRGLPVYCLACGLKPSCQKQEKK
jgi:hypothetical protein